MPGGKRNPLSMSNMLEHLGEVVQNTKEKVQSANDTIHTQKTHTKSTITKKMGEHGHLIPYVDLVIQFIGASGLPKMDVVGSADPYFVATLDDQISFVSQVKQSTLSPIWNELWRVKNVPAIADLLIKLMDKDDGMMTDDYIGKAKTSVSAGAKELEIEGPVLQLRRKRGTIWVKIESTPSQDPSPGSHPYLFDGPIRFSRHYSPTVGALTNLDQARLYSTWKLYLKGVPLFFGDTHQGWNKNYKAAQSIFSPGPTSLAVRSGIQAGHKMLYARTSKNGFGVVGCGGHNHDSDTSGNNVAKDEGEDHGIAFTQLLLHGDVPTGVRPGWGTARSSSLFTSHSRTGSQSNNDQLAKPDTPSEPKPAPDSIDQLALTSSSPYAQRIKPAVYTYIISSDDESFRFSETGAAFFVDFASKHALHANCATRVRYSGEFHPRPRIPGVPGGGGWSAFNESMRDDEVDWELVIDNNSGTYSPSKDMLPALKALLEHNFPGLGIVALDHADEELKKSREACREYAARWRGVVGTAGNHKEGGEARKEEKTLAQIAMEAAEKEVSSVEGK